MEIVTQPSLVEESLIINENVKNLKTKRTFGQDVTNLVNNNLGSKAKEDTNNIIRPVKQARHSINENVYGQKRYNLRSSKTIIEDENINNKPKSENQNDNDNDNENQPIKKSTESQQSFKASLLYSSTLHLSKSVSAITISVPEESLTSKIVAPKISNTRSKRKRSAAIAFKGDIEEETEKEEEHEISNVEINDETNDLYKIPIVLAECDLLDKNNELASVYYVQDIMSRLKKAEKDYSLGDNNDFMKSQKDINSRMRTILLDWLVEVHRKFQLLPATFYLAINILDRYLSIAQVDRNHFQLTGCACLWIASKYHEIYAPEIQDFVYISDNAFNKTNLIEKESDVLEKLCFQLTVPTPLSFIERYLKLVHYRFSKNNRLKEYKIIEYLTFYYIEHSLMDYDLSRNLPSYIASSCLAFSLYFTKFSDWTNELIEETGYKLSELLPTMINLLNLLNKTNCKHKAVRKKYSQPKYHKVSLFDHSKFDVKILNDMLNQES